MSRDNCETYYVMAEDESEAESVDTRLGDCTVQVFEAKGVESEWYNAIPSNSDDMIGLVGK